MRLQRILFAAALPLAACAADVADDSFNPWASDDGKADGWDSRNDPTIFEDVLGAPMDYKLANLPLAGEAKQKPWPDTYWPDRLDAHNHRWQGPTELSPLEKYDLAFNGWVPASGFESLRPFDAETCSSDWDREYYDRLGPAATWHNKSPFGNRRVRDAVDSDFDGQIDECDDFEGIEGWFGHCHAWAPAALLEPEPAKNVVVAGVTFTPGDIKALLNAVYDDVELTNLGSKCYTRKVKRDAQGRIEADECRDTNAGAFHVVLANFIGLHGIGLGEDRTYNFEEWNQPVLGYSVEGPIAPFRDPALANQLLGRSGDTYLFNPNAVQFADVRMSVRYITESSPTARPLLPELERYIRTDRYHYLLELDGEGRIIGGEWINGASEDGSRGYSDQPDFLWVARGPNLTGPSNWSNPNLDYQKIKSLLATSIAP